MPIWAIIYLIILTLSTLYTIRLLRMIPYFWVGEALALSFVYGFFLIYYEKIPLPDLFIYPLLMGLYILYWEYWVYKNIIASMLSEIHTHPKELAITLLITFFPLFYVMVHVLLNYFQMP